MNLYTYTFDGARESCFARHFDDVLGRIVRIHGLGASYKVRLIEHREAQPEELAAHRLVIAEATVEAQAKTIADLRLSLSRANEALARANPDQSAELKRLQDLAYLRLGTIKKLRDRRVATMEHVRSVVSANLRSQAKLKAAKDYIAGL